MNRFLTGTLWEDAFAEDARQRAANGFAVTPAPGWETEAWLRDNVAPLIELGVAAFALWILARLAWWFHKGGATGSLGALRRYLAARL